MTTDREIHELAYYLWISEGKPTGQSDRHWKMATEMAAQQASQKNGGATQKKSTDPSECKGKTEPAQPDQT